MGGEHGGVLAGEVVAAVFGGGEVVGEGLHEGVAGRGVGGAGCVQGLGDADDGL